EKLPARPPPVSRDRDRNRNRLCAYSSPPHPIPLPQGEREPSSVGDKATAEADFLRIRSAPRPRQGSPGRAPPYASSGGGESRVRTTTWLPPSNPTATALDGRPPRNMDRFMLAQTS